MDRRPGDLQKRFKKGKDAAAAEAERRREAFERLQSENVEVVDPNANYGLLEEFKDDEVWQRMYIMFMAEPDRQKASHLLRDFVINYCIEVQTVMSNKDAATERVKAAKRIHQKLQALRME